MGLYWPIRWILSWACRSTAGFHQGSIKKTCNEKHEKPVMDQDYQRSDKKKDETEDISSGRETWSRYKKRQHASWRWLLRERDSNYKGQIKNRETKKKRETISFMLKWFNNRVHHKLEQLHYSKTRKIQLMEDNEDGQCKQEQNYRGKWLQSPVTTGQLDFRNYYEKRLSYMWSNSEIQSNTSSF